MRISALLPLLASGLAYAASWGFEDGTISVREIKGSYEASSKKYVLQFSFYLRMISADY
jgi:hypothetical protein